MITYQGPSWAPFQSLKKNDFFFYLDPTLGNLGPWDLKGSVEALDLGPRGLKGPVGALDLGPRVHNDPSSGI